MAAYVILVKFSSHCFIDLFKQKRGEGIEVGIEGNEVHMWM